MSLKGLSTGEAQRRLRGQVVTLGKDLLADIPGELLDLLEWRHATQVDLVVRENVIPGNNRPYWAGSEGFVFGIEVRVDGKPKEDQSHGKLLLKVLSDEAIRTPGEGELRKRRAEFLCSPAMNLHLRLRMHDVKDRLLFAGAPVLSFTHSLGMGDGSGEYICTVMHNAGAPARCRVMQWGELREQRILSVRERLWLAHDLARCVGIMEELDLVHGDLSPDNVLVLIPESASNRPKISLVDFDLFYARTALCPMLPLHGPPPDGVAPGHEGYQPPLGMRLYDIENGEGSDHSVRYDRFALGLLVFEFLAWCGVTWGEPLIRQDSIDRLKTNEDSRKLLGNLAFALSNQVLNLLGRAINRDSAGWPSPQEWIGGLESRNVYRLCFNPMRSKVEAEQRSCLCAWPAPDAFAEAVRSRSAPDRNRLASESAMSRFFGRWVFAPVSSSRKSAELGARSACGQRGFRRGVDFWKAPSIWPLVHFRWMAEEPAATAAFLDRRVEGHSACPVCGGALTIAGEVKA